MKRRCVDVYVPGLETQCPRCAACLSDRRCHVLVKKPFVLEYSVPLLVDGLLVAGRHAPEPCCVIFPYAVHTVGAGRLVVPSFDLHVVQLVFPAAHTMARTPMNLRSIMRCTTPHAILPDITISPLRITVVHVFQANMPSLRRQTSAPIRGG